MFQFENASYMQGCNNTIINMMTESYKLVTLPEFTKIKIWQKSIHVCAKVYECTEKISLYEKYNILQQIRRASCSIPANIAEGLGRYYFKDKIRFYYQARGSLYEVQNFLFIAETLGYLNKDSVSELVCEYEYLSAMIKSFINKVGN